MIMDGQFFEKLVDFLPKHVSPMRSYAHGGVAFLVTFLVAYLILPRSLDHDRDGVVSETEKRTQEGVRVAVSVIASLLVADLVFSLSWRRRNFTINKNHMTYRRWFPSFY